MSNSIPAFLTFENTQLSIIDHVGQVWLTATELARGLGYKQLNAITKIYSRNKDEFTEDMTQVIDTSSNTQFGSEGKQVNMTRIFSPRGCHLIAMFSRTEKAKSFRRWTLDVLDKVITQPVSKAATEIKTVKTCDYRDMRKLRDKIIASSNSIEATNAAFTLYNMAVHYWTALDEWGGGAMRSRNKKFEIQL